MNRRTLLFGMLGGIVSTNHHTAIATGTATTASTTNNLLGQLDDSVSAVEPHIDNLILSDDEPDAEVIDSRNGYDRLDDRLNELMHVSSMLLVDPAFTGLPTAKRFTTITAAIAACSGGETILVAPGIYTENIAISSPNLTIAGSGMPAYDSDTGRLVGGTIIRGYIDTDVAVGLTIRDLGVDLADSTMNALDCIGATNADFVANRTYVNLALRGNGDTGTYAMHGLYIVGSNTQVNNVRVYRCYHGIAVHGNRLSLNNLYFYACYGTSLVIKGKNTFPVYDVNVTNIVLEGTTDFSNGRVGPIAIQNANNTDTYDVNITNVTATDCILGVFQIHKTESDGEIHDINLTNVISRNANNAALLWDFRIVDVDRLTLTNCQSFNRAGGYAFQIDNSPNISDVRLYGCTADSSGSGPFSQGSSGAVFEVREINGEYFRYAGRRLVQSGALVSHWESGLFTGGIAVTGVDTPICALASGTGTATEYHGMLFISARNGTGTAFNSASYIIHVHKYYSQTSVEVAGVSSAGLDSGAAPLHPSFTFSGDYANDHLVVTPIGSTSGTFYFTITAIGNIRVTSLVTV